jgi:FkbM family methyltransferase
VAFEPNPAVRARLIEHVVLNAQQQLVMVAEAALGAADRPATLYVPARIEESGLASLQPTARLVDHAAAAVPVSMMRLDSWMAANACGPARIMKIDVEGAEAGVLTGADEWFTASPPAHVICETTCDGPAHRWLAARGYDATMLDVFDRERGLGNMLFSRAARPLAER